VKGAVTSIHERKAAANLTLRALGGDWPIQVSDRVISFLAMGCGAGPPHAVHRHSLCAFAAISGERIPIDKPFRQLDLAILQTPAHRAIHAEIYLQDVWN
jgi:hypothetical protein